MVHIAKGFQKEFEECGALWVHSGNPQAPHALLASGKHSSGFFNASKVIERPLLLTQALQRLVSISGVGMQGITRVIGSERGAVEISFDTARHLLAFHSTTAKTEDGRMELKRFELQKSDHILVVEDVLTTGGTTFKTIDGLMKAGEGLDISFHPKLLVLVNRSEMTHLKTPAKDLEVCGLIDIPMPIWSPEECPLCKAGSRALRPKENWDELVAQ